jgi:hypothetical protein
MARVQGSIEVDKATWDAADKILAKLDIAIRGTAIDGALRKVGNGIKSKTKAILPKPGYPGDKPDMVPLRETLKVKVKQYEGGKIKMGIVGYSYSREKGKGGNHGHLLEGGHILVAWGRRTGRRVKAYEYMIRVCEDTKAEQKATIINTIAGTLTKVASGG